MNRWLLKTMARSFLKENQTDTPFTQTHASDGFSGDAVVVSATDVERLEQVANQLANAAHHTVLTGEGLTDLERALHNYDQLTNRRR